MEISGSVEQNVQYCFPSNNVSCLKEIRSRSEIIILYSFFAALSLCTVFLNLLVIISISHFKQLHTPTNLVILSLAVADFVVGVFVMPIESVRLIDNCWYFGVTFCSLFPFIIYIVVSASLGNLVFISIDRYIAVRDPLRYHSKVTNRKTLFCIFLSWFWAVLYAVINLYDHMNHPVVYSSCYGHCIVVIDYTLAIIDLIITFLSPCTAMITLYIRIYITARRQITLISTATFNVYHSTENELTTAKKSGHKAAKTLGIVVFMYLICWIPYYISLLTESSVSTSSLMFNVFSWFTYINSCINPVIYALFYPWFKTSAQHILTLKILNPSSSLKNLFPENQ
ncbi:trace amine-associated receptor 13c-like [Sardina pilchardus]|uniref:trace amine-associated receptor 13c-like n=1 Tax=Sardina pilchardus TaxID=27697 RepID=UPI002E0F5AEC